MGKIGDRLSMGMTRTQVEQEMGQDLKRRYYCDLGNTSVGVYLIGSKDPKRAGILHLRYARVGEQEILQKIEGLDPDMLFQFEGHGCTVLEY
jgi:hypothetical protein